MDPHTVPFPGDPGVNPDVKSYWDGCNSGKLLLTRCRATGRVFAYPRSVSPFTLGDDVEWFEAKGTGVIYAFSTSAMSAARYTIAYVLLDEGVSILTGIVDGAEGRLKIGQTVKLVFQTSASGQKVPFFAPT